MPNRRHQMLSHLTLGLALLSEFLYFRSAFGMVSFFLVLSLPLAILWILSFPKFPVNRLVGTAYAFVSLVACYVVVGTLLYQKFTLLGQLLFVLLSPLIFLHLGYFGNIRAILNFLYIFLIASSCLAILQFLYWGLGIAGPANFFQIIGEVFLKIQSDFLAENIFGRSSAFFANPNSLGLFSGLAFWVIFYLSSELGKLQRIFIYVLLSVCVVLSASRGSLAGILISLAAYGGVKSLTGRAVRIRFRPRKLAGLLVLVLFVGFAISRLPDGQLQRLSELFSVISNGGVGGSENLEGRAQAWRTIIYRLNDFPFGTLIPPQLLIDESPDNQFIYYFAQGGYLLLLASLFFYGAIMIFALSARTEGGRVLFAAMVFFAINSLTMIVMNSYVSCLLWLLVGLAARDSASIVRRRAQI